MAQQVLIPEKRGGISGLMNMFSQGAGMLQMGAKGKEGFTSLMGGSGGGGGAEGLGAGAGAYSLGVGNVAPVTTGMSPTLGGGTAAGTTTGGATTAAGSGGGGTAAAMGSSIMGPAAAVGLGYYSQYKIGEANDAKVKANNDKAKAEYRANPGLAVDFRDDLYGKKASAQGSAPSGLSLTDTDKMSAVERRYNNNRNPMGAIEAAQSALAEADLPDAERRSIYQKLELARQGGQKRGSSIYS